MPTFFILFFIVQMLALLLITLHDWIHLPPITNIHELAKHHSRKERLFNSIIFFFLVFIPLALSWHYQSKMSIWVLIIINVFYGLLTIGTILSWWIPYFFGSPPEHKKGFAEYANTHHFLPPRQDNIIPNTFHVLMHLVIWTCFGMALYLLSNIF